MLPRRREAQLAGRPLRPGTSPAWRTPCAPKRGTGRDRPRVRTLRCMQGMVSAGLLVGAFAVVAATAAFAAARLHRLTRAGRPLDPPDA